MGDGSQGDQEGGAMLPPSDFANIEKKSEAEIKDLLKVSYIQNEIMRSSFFPKCKPKITRISALPYKHGS